MNSIADLKRALTAGTNVTVTDHIHPHLNGERSVVKAQTKSVCLSFPAGHPSIGEHAGSWLTWPKRERMVFDGDTVSLLLDDGSLFLRLRVAA